ncbi:DUF397 domain-containing protein [Nocardiopsis flavescens]|uniref:DUF397 domain-containing protein n=1 Tax=Nocardiopsis flavescens TaxID=758803 RepID=UPI0036DBD21D
MGCCNDYWNPSRSGGGRPCVASLVGCSTGSRQVSGPSFRRSGQPVSPARENTSRDGLTSDRVGGGRAIAEERAWHKSSRSNGTGGNCVEVSEGAETLVGDTRHRELGHLGFTAGEWAALLRALAR